jgi:NTE family protein
MNKIVKVSDCRPIAADKIARAGQPPQKPRQVVLVFQGGGALGAYQAGVYQALHEAHIEPDWVIGTSIGAINASLIAGSRPSDRLEKLEEFWARMTRKEIRSLLSWRGLTDTVSYWSTVFGGIPGFFEPNPMAFLGSHMHLGADQAGYYSTAALEKTLSELVDFSLIKQCTPRLTVGAAHVCTSQMRYFDSRETAITAKHIMASGALPPAFPPFASTVSSIGTAAFSPIRPPRRSSTTTRGRTR